MWRERAITGLDCEAKNKVRVRVCTMYTFYVLFPLVNAPKRDEDQVQYTWMKGWVAMLAGPTVSHN